MEKKLGINKERGKIQFKKRLAQENYDDDFLDFLDHIDTVVKDEKTNPQKQTPTPINKKKIKVKEDVIEKVDGNEQNEEEKLNCK